MEEAITRFLLDVMGYRKIEALLNGEKPSDMKIRDFLSGTIFATFSAYSAMSESKVTMPLISKIHSVKKADSTEQRWMSQELKSSGLEWLIDNMTMFRYQTPDEIAEYVRGFSRQLFPESKPEYETKEYKTRKSRNISFDIRIRDDGFFFVVRGNKQTKSARRMTIVFNLERGTVEAINTVAARYYVVINKPHTELTFSAKFLNRSKGIVIDEALLRMVGVFDSELSKRITAAKPPVYVGADAEGYKTGALMEHLHFGPGIVTDKKEPGKMQVYFPRLLKKKSLICRD